MRGYKISKPGRNVGQTKRWKLFSKLNLSDAYLQILLEEDCLMLLITKTPEGLFKIERLPFGIKVAASIFQQIMDTMLTVLNFAQAYLTEWLTD